MITVKRKENKIISAWQLGADSVMEAVLIGEGKIKKFGDGVYEIFSQESVNGVGEIAYEGDYFKVDSAGYPYPNSREFFEENHIHRAADEYEQIGKPLKAWCVGMDVCEEVIYLQETKGLVINENDPQKYFNAPLWGTMLSAGKDAYIVFYSVFRNEDNTIADIDFNFVAKDEFDKTYDILQN